MIKNVVFVFLFLCSTAYAGIGVEHDGAGNIVRLDARANPAAYDCANCVYWHVGGNVTAEGYENLENFIRTRERRFIKWVDGLAEMTQAEKDAILQAEAIAQAQAQLSGARSGAKTSVDELSAEGVRLRAALLVILDEINALRQRDRDRAVDVSLATNLSDLKTRWAARSELADREASQIKTALKSKIDAGTAD